ncbi:MAG: sodium:proton antiporter [Candidatus Marinimicrobia bacterium]|nr:sodium:proton antiporter [Candidatus Neomarinimicrobiota bacterium]MDP7072251.1 sodium:proton antiporter [Candidatus Neomarinimicrobiota bacterium]
MNTKFQKSSSVMVRIPIILGILSEFLSAAGTEAAPHLEGSMLSIYWVIPFAGILLSIALFPLVAPRFWHRHYGKVSFLWSSGLLLGMVFSEQIGLRVAVYELLHVGLLEYVPFILLLLSLFTVSGGIYLSGTLLGTPIVNTGIILIGTVLASWMGTTGAAILLIRPLMRANKKRTFKVHTIVFFIFLVANIGGSLTPLGDPPLFLGFLEGVDFFWTTSAMFLPMLFMAGTLLVIYYGMDSFYYAKEPVPLTHDSEESEKLKISGGVNFLLLGGILGSVILSGFWDPHIEFLFGGVHLKLQNIVRDVLLLTITIVSLKITSQSIRDANEFTWEPIREVAKLFAGIFTTIIPAIAILKAGENGSLSFLIQSLSNENGPVNMMYFWLTGILSSFLDNAPTYLVFFNSTGQSASELMTTYHNTLMAISAGAVFMGANTYIGNAPNFMVKSIAESGGIRMPSFFGYFFRYAVVILFPLYIIWSVIFL